MGSSGSAWAVAASSATTSVRPTSSTRTTMGGGHSAVAMRRKTRVSARPAPLSISCHGSELPVRYALRLAPLVFVRLGAFVTAQWAGIDLEGAE